MLHWQENPSLHIKIRIGENDDSFYQDYLVYFAEEKESANITLNQTINPLKFYYEGMLKRNFLCKSKRPCKVYSSRSLPALSGSRYLRQSDTGHDMRYPFTMIEK